MKYLVILDDGHGMETAGKRTPKFEDGTFMKENEFNNRVVTLLNNYLLEHNKKYPSSNSFIPYLCAEGTTDVPLATRTARANNKYDDVRRQYTDVKAIFISVHANALSSVWNENVKGIETYHYPNAKDSQQLAMMVQDHLMKGTPLKNRGVKSADFHVLRETKMTAVLVEAGFMDNPYEAMLLKSEAYREECAKEIYDAIRLYFGIKDSIFISNDKNEADVPMGTPIFSNSTATVKHMQAWAKERNASGLFIELAPIFYSVARKEGVNPALVYAQSAKETGYMKFGGVIDGTYCNPCGLKIPQGGGCTDPNAHMKFPNWETGILAQVQHLALYAGRVYDNPVDPRHFPYLKGKCKSVEELGGNWCPDKKYGTDIVLMMRAIASVKVVEDKPEVSEPSNGNCNHDVCVDTSAHNVTYIYDTHVNAHVLMVNPKTLKPMLGNNPISKTTSTHCVGCYRKILFANTSKEYVDKVEEKQPVIYYADGKIVFNASVSSLGELKGYDWCIGGKSISGNVIDMTSEYRTILGYSKEKNELLIISPKDACTYKELKSICNQYKLAFAIEIASGNKVNMKVSNHIKYDNDALIEHYLIFK